MIKPTITKSPELELWRFKHRASYRASSLGTSTALPQPPSFQLPPHPSFQLQRNQTNTTLSWGKYQLDGRASCGLIDRWRWWSSDTENLLYSPSRPWYQDYISKGTNWSLSLLTFARQCPLHQRQCQWTSTPCEWCRLRFGQIAGGSFIRTTLEQSELIAEPIQEKSCHRNQTCLPSFVLQDP